MVLQLLSNKKIKKNKMKNKLLIFPVIVALVLGFSSCTPTTKNDISEYINSFTVGAYLRGQAVLNSNTGAWVNQSTISNTIDANNLANARMGVRVRPWGSPISKVNVYVVRGQSTKPADWKLVKSYDRNPSDTSYFDIIVTAPEIATTLGIALNTNAGNFTLGQAFNCYTEVITTDGRKFTVNNTNADITAGGNAYFAIFNFSAAVVCPFVAAGFAGDYRVDIDEWEDWAPGDVLTGAVVSAVQGAANDTSTYLLRVFPNPAFGGNNQTNVTVRVATATGISVVRNQYYGNYGATPIHNTTTGNANFTYSCTGVIDLNLLHHVPNNPGLVYGGRPFRLKLTKQ
jgi:hypothetical protein